MSTPSPWKYFSVEELSCRCGCKQMAMNADFMEKAVKLRQHFGFPMIINSAYRCSAYDQKVGSSAEPGNGPHTKGHALDIRVYGERARLLLEKAFDLNLFTGFGLDQRVSIPQGSRFVHLDDLLQSEANGSPRPHLWGYP